MYIKPTRYGVKHAIKCGWNIEDAKRGFALFDYDGLGILEVEAIDDCYIDQEYSDEDCAHEAERIGLCNIIPIDELPLNFEANGHSLRWFGWVDSAENRMAIEKYCTEDRA